MLRLGIISELGSGNNLGFARVSFDEVAMVSGWLPLPSFGTKTDKIWLPIEVNSQVACLMDDDCEQGCITAVLWSDTDTPPKWANENTIGIQFSDGAKVFYDSKAHTLFMDAPDSDINVTCKTLNVTGNVSIDGDSSVTGDVSSKGNIHANGNIDANGNISTPTVNLNTHMHPTAATGSPSPPTPGS